MGFVQVVNVLLAQILELEGDCAKKITNLGFITTKRLSKLKKKPDNLFDNSREKGVSLFLGM